MLVVVVLQLLLSSLLLTTHVRFDPNLKFKSTRRYILKKKAIHNSELRLESSRDLCCHEKVEESERTLIHS